MRRNKFTKNELDSLFEEATIEAARIKGKKLMEDAEKDAHYPSAEFNHRIQSIIENKTKKSDTFDFFNKAFLAYSKASAWILLSLILLFVSVPNVALARNWITRLVIDANPKYVTYYFQENEINQINQDSTLHGPFPKGIYYPSYLPKEMTLMQLIYDPSEIIYRYQDVSDNTLTVIVMGPGSSTNLDNESSEEESKEYVNGIEADYRKRIGLGQLTWSDGIHVFIVSTTLSKEECLRIANGLTN